MASIKLKLPDVGGNPTFVEGKDSVVLIGANGSGKTRMSIWFERNNQNFNFHRISAQKSLNMPTITRPSDLEKTQEAFFYGTINDNKDWLKRQGKVSGRWGGNPVIHLLNDFSNLMEVLVTEEYEKSLQYRQEHKAGNNCFDNVTNLETIKKIWENIIANKTLSISAGKVEASNKNSPKEKFNGAEMSDGERAIFYFSAKLSVYQQTP